MTILEAEMERAEMVHEEIESSEDSPRVEYIENFYFSNPRKYSKKKVRQIGSLSSTEQEHIIEHIHLTRVTEWRRRAKFRRAALKGKSYLASKAKVIAK